MKGFIRACLLLSLRATSVAHGYESDIHFSATYAIARAVGWPAADALTIASANQAVDENPDTVAALEMDTAPGPALVSRFTSSMHQAERNLDLHCFSETPGRAGRISADVIRVIARHFAEVPGRDADPRNHTRRLISLGVALHCQQDAYSHAGFGGSCGSHAGSCYGHTYETFIDQVAFGLVRRHLFDPDHPGVSGERLTEALAATVSRLAVRLPRDSARSVPAGALTALADALRESGLELPDEARRECNRYIAGKWLFDFIHAGSGMPGADVAVKLGPEVADTCGDAALASATIVQIPAPRFPRLNADASPSLVRADGTYGLVGAEHFDATPTGAGPAGIVNLVANYKTRESTIRLSHWRQFLALPLVMKVALLSAYGSAEAR